MVVQRSHMEAPYMLKAMQEVWELLCTTTMYHNVVYLDC